MKRHPSPQDFPVSNDGIRAALDTLLADADAARVARSVAHRLAVIVDEYCSNLVRHDVTITPASRFRMRLEPVEGGATLTLCDNAAPFDPTASHPPPDREIGGQGIVLMKGLAATLDYSSARGRNVFRATVLAD